MKKGVLQESLDVEPPQINHPAPQRLWLGDSAAKAEMVCHPSRRQGEQPWVGYQKAAKAAVSSRTTPDMLTDELQSLPPPCGPESNSSGKAFTCLVCCDGIGWTPTEESTEWAGLFLEVWGKSCVYPLDTFLEAMWAGTFVLQMLREAE